MNPLEREARASAALATPVDCEELIAAVRSWLRARRSQALADDGAAGPPRADVSNAAAAVVMAALELAISLGAVDATMLPRASGGGLQP